MADDGYEYAVQCTIRDQVGAKPIKQIYMQSTDRARVEKWLEDHRSDTKNSKLHHGSALVRRPANVEWEEVE